MANLEHIERLIRSVQEWNQWREEHPEIQIDLSYTDLRKTNLQDANLSGANLRGADLRRSNLYDTHLGGADLRGADLSGLFLGYTNLNGAKLEGANLRGASGAVDHRPKRWSEIRQPDQSSTTTNWFSLVTPVQSDFFITVATLAAIIQGLDVVERRWREHKKKHQQQAISPAPPIPDAEITENLLVMDDGSQHGFRRWILDPDSLRTYIDAFSNPTSKVKPYQVVFVKRRGRALVVDITTDGKENQQLNVILSYLELPSDSSSLFISYAHQDALIARRLHTDLRNKGVPCWFAPHDLPPGTLMVRGIEEAIYQQDKLLLILSADAMVSNWVQLEVETALYKEVTSGREMLFPIRLDNTILERNTQWAKRLCKRHIGDFTGWQDKAAYQQAFATLLQHLKVAKPPPTV